MAISMNSQIGSNKTNSILDSESSRARTMRSNKETQPCRPTTAAHPVPDRHGRTSTPPTPSCSALLALYLPADLLRAPAAALRAARRAGRRRARRARAHRRPATRRRSQHRTRTGSDAQRVDQAPGLRRDGAPRVQRVRPGRDVAPRRRARLERADAAGGQVRADLPVRAGRVRPVLPAVDDRFADAHAAQVRRARRWSSASCRA